MVISRQIHQLLKFKATLWKLTSERKTILICHSFCGQKQIFQKPIAIRIFSLGIVYNEILKLTTF
jgi:hypothetical protein